MGAGERVNVDDVPVPEGGVAGQGSTAAFPMMDPRPEPPLQQVPTQEPEVVPPPFDGEVLPPEQTTPTSPSEGGSAEQGYALTTTSDGDMWFAGSTRGAFDGYENADGSMRLFVMRIRPDGEAALAEQSPWVTGVGTALAPASDGGFWLASSGAPLSRWSQQGAMESEWSTDDCQGIPTGVALGDDGARVVVLWGAGDPTDYALCVAKWDGDGELLWEYRHEAGYEPRGVVVDDSGAIYVAGRGGLYWDENFWGPGMRRVVSYGFLLKLDGDGGLLWEEQWGGARGTGARGLTSDGDGGVIVTGSSMDRLTDGGPDREVEHGFVGRWGSDGSRLWLRESADNRGGMAVMLGTDGLVRVAGDSLSGTEGGSYVEALSLEGDSLWRVQWPASTSSSALFGAALNRDDEVYATGWAFEPGPVDPDRVDAFVGKVSADGQLLWSNLYGPD